jgi:trigger factor
MQVSVESPSKLERRLTVSVPTDQVEEAYDKRIAKIAKTAKVDGFRVGKIPVNYVKQRFGDTARQEALSEVIQSSLYAAIHQEKLNPVSTPTVETKTVMPGQPLEFIATFEVLPEIGPVVFELKTIEKQIATITETDIVGVIDRLRKQGTTFKIVDRAAQQKDQIVIDFRGTIDGKALEGGEAHDYPVIIGSNTMIPGFEEGLIGLKANDEKTLHLTFPENYHVKDIASKAVEFAVTAIKVSEPNLPELDAAFLKKLGVKSGSIDDLHAEIRKNLERELARLIKMKLKNQVFNKLIEQNTLEIPKSLVEREANRLHDELHPQHAGKPHSHTPAEMAEFNEAAERNVILGLLVSELLKQYKITLNKEKMEAQINELSAMYENPAEVAKWYASDKKARSQIEMQVLEEQLVEKLLENSQIIEKMLTYNELITSQ